MSIKQDVLVTEGGMRLHTESPWLLVGNSQYFRPTASNIFAAMTIEILPAHIAALLGRWLSGSRGYSMEMD